MNKILVVSAVGAAMAIMIMAMAGCSSDEARLTYLHARDQLLNTLDQTAQTVESSREDTLAKNGCYLYQSRIVPLVRFAPQFDQLKSSVFESTYCAGFDSNNNCTGWITDRIQPGYDKTVEMVNALHVLGGHVTHLCSLPASQAKQIAYETRYVAWFIKSETIPRLREYDRLVRRQTRWSNDANQRP